MRPGPARGTTWLACGRTRRTGPPCGCSTRRPSRAPTTSSTGRSTAPSSARSRAMPCRRARRGSSARTTIRCRRRACRTASPCRSWCTAGRSWRPDRWSARRPTTPPTSSGTRANGPPHPREPWSHGPPDAPSGGLFVTERALSVDLIRPMHTPRAFYCGLFATALATLVLEVVDTRLLSVITWYHLAFLAISLAMLGMTAGAVFAYLRPERFTEAAALAQVSRFATFFALSMPLSHLAVLAIRVPTQLTTQPMDLWTLAFASGLLAAPFCFAGVVVAVSLTRVPLPIGRVYAADLLGAGLGCAAAILLLESADPTPVTFLLAALAGLGAAAYRLAAGRGRVIASLALAAALLFVAFANRSLYPRLFWIGIMKGNPVPAPVLYDRWNSHSRVTARAAARGTPALWGAGSATPPAQVEQIPLRI